MPNTVQTYAAMTLSEQIQHVENILRMCKSAGTDYAPWEAILITLRKHERASEIMQSLEHDFRKLDGKTWLQKTALAGQIAIGHWTTFLEMGRIFLKF